MELAAEPERTDKLTLATGLELVLDTPQIPNYVVLALQLKAGSAAEPPALAGFFNFLHKSALQRLTANSYVFSQSKAEYCAEQFCLTGACMGYQVEEFLGAFAAALAPEALSADVLESLELEEHVDLTQETLHVAYGGRGPGAYPHGSGESLRAPGFLDRAREFQRSLLHPANLTVYASGVYNRAEFAAVCAAALAPLAGGQPLRPDAAAQRYVGGSLQRAKRKRPGTGLFEQSEYDAEELAVVFPTVGHAHPDHLHLQLMETLLGQFSYFTGEGPGRGTQARLKASFSRCAAASFYGPLHRAFRHGGVFGLQAKGTAGSGESLLRLVARDLKALQGPVLPAELELAKNIFLSDHFMALQGQFNRLERLAQRYL